MPNDKRQDALLSGRPKEKFHLEASADFRKRRTQFRRHLRNEATTAEAMLWKRLRRRQLEGRKFRRQHPVGPYIVDFFCATAHLAIELDGAVHDDPDRWAYDTQRTRFLESKGIRVLRFENEQVVRSIDDVVHGILWTIDPSLVG